MKLPTSWGPATVLVVAVIVIVVAAGAVVTVVNPDTLSFSDYLDTLSKAAIGAGVLGVGRGLLSGASGQRGRCAGGPRLGVRRDPAGRLLRGARRPGRRRREGRGRVSSAHPSGLGPKARIDARHRTVYAARLAYAHRGAIHYTQGSRRWEGIAKGLHAYRGQYPRYADCSAFATWACGTACTSSTGSATS
jgi:hypothetical protein